MRRSLLAALLLAIPVTAAAAVDLLAPTTTTPFLASDGTDFLAVWTEPNSSGRVRAARVTRAGVVLDPFPAIDIGPGLVLGVAYGSGTYLIVSNNSRGLVATRVTQSGVRIDEFGPVLDARAGNAAVVFDGSRFFVTWTDGLAVYGSFFTLDAHVSPRQTLAAKIQDRLFFDPSMAWDGRRFLAVWSTGAPFCFADPCLPFASEIVAFRVAADGTPLEAPVRIADALSGIAAAVASSGQDFLVAVRRKGYDDAVATSVVRALIVDAERGVNVRATRQLTNWFPFGIAAAWTGTDYEVMWSYTTTAHIQYHLASAHIDRAGNVTAQRSVRADGLGFQFSPAANAAGEMAIAARHNSQPSVTFDRDITATLPAPPARPSISLNTTSVTWSVSEPVDGFVVESVGSDYEPFVFRTLVPPVGGLATADLRMPINGNGGFVPSRIRVRAFNAGGFSEPSATVQLVETRGRAARH